MLKPGNTQWKKVLQASTPHHDSLEGLLRQPLLIQGHNYNSSVGTPKRGALVTIDDGAFTPIVAAEVLGLVSGNTYKVKFAVTKFDTAFAISAVNSAGTLTSVTATSYTQAVTDPVTGLVTGEDTITFSAALPANTEIIVFTAAASLPLVGVVYESTQDSNFSLAVEALGVRPEQVYGGNSFFVKNLPGVKRIENLLFIRTV